MANMQDFKESTKGGGRKSRLKERVRAELIGIGLLLLAVFIFSSLMSDRKSVV